MTDYLLIEKIQKALRHIKEEAGDYISGETLTEVGELEAELELSKTKSKTVAQVKEEIAAKRGWESWENLLYGSSKKSLDKTIDDLIESLNKEKSE